MPGRASRWRVVDSGVDLQAAAIAQGYRGRLSDWFDPYAQQRYPADSTGHGTLVAGLLVGGLIDDTPIGVAPRARWIAARLFDDAGQGRASAVQRIYQWVLDPDGDPATPDAPDIVNNSWGLPQSAGQCDTSFARALAALRAADIHVVFAAGNDGPAGNTSMSPANNPGVLSVGALNPDRGIAERSSRGPSGCGGGPFPSLYAPGVNLPALDRIAASIGSAALADGTSFAAAAVSGALARVAQRAARSRHGRDRSAAAEQRAARQRGRGGRRARACGWPNLDAALAAMKLPAAGGTPNAPVLRWSPLGRGRQAARGLARQSAQRAAVVDPGARDPPAGAAGDRRLESQAAAGSGCSDDRRPGPTRPTPRSRQRCDSRCRRLRGAELVLELAPQPPATVTVPPRQRQAVQTLSNRSVQVRLAGALNDAPPDTLRLTFAAAGGKLKRLPDGLVEYTPPANFVGTDQFTYSLRGARAPTISRRP